MAHTASRIIGVERARIIMAWRIGAEAAAVDHRRHFERHAATISTAAEPTHRDELATLATAAAVAQVASDRCPDIYVLVDGLNNLSSNSHLVPSDDMAVQIEVRGNTKAYNDQIDKAGVKAWCDDVLNYFGPEGTLMRGLLKRQ